MLNKLQKKLYRALVSVLMLIVTFILVLIQYDSIRGARTAENILFQRMATLMIYQLSGDTAGSAEEFAAYEREYQIFIRLAGEDGSLLYESSLEFPTDRGVLVGRLERQMGRFEANRVRGKKVTEQGGIFRISGEHRETYLGIPAAVVNAEGDELRLILLCRRTPAMELIRDRILFLGSIWLAAFAGILLICRALLKRAMEPTRKGLEGQKQFVASASHELKAPLSVISAEAEEIGNLAAGDREITACVQGIDSECRRMSGLVQDMLLLAASDAGAVSLHPRKVDADTVLFSLYESYEGLCIRNEICLKAEPGEEKFPALTADPDRLMQILRIFMDNAVRFSEKGSGIELQARALKNEIMFSVVDHGAGISEADAPHVFERFYCGDRSRTEKSHYGMGLAIAGEITRMMNGRTGYCDTPGGGCTFWVALPVK